MENRWMLFVDGENFTLRAQEVLATKSLSFNRPSHYEKDVFCWFPNGERKVSTSLIFSQEMGIIVTSYPVRCHYYTTTHGDVQARMSVQERLFDLGFHPEVFPKVKGKKSKGVDIALAKDMLAHAFRDNYDIAVLSAGDGDYVPLVEEVKRIGKVVIVAFLASGLNSSLRLASDRYVALDQLLESYWKWSAANPP